MREAIREGILRLSMVGGVLVGLLWGWRDQVHPACSHHGPATTLLERCTNHSIGVIAGHWGVAIGGGVLLGLLVALGMLALLEMIRVVARA
jgi:hypothetical protein